MPEVDGDLQLAPSALLVAGPGAAWPPLPGGGRAADARTASRPRPAAGLRSCTARCRCGAWPAASSASRRRASAPWPSPSRSRSPAGPRSGRSSASTWTGSDPRPGTWTALDRDGQPVGADGVAARVRRSRRAARGRPRPHRPGRAVRVLGVGSDALPRARSPGARTTAERSSSTCPSSTRSRSPADARVADGGDVRLRERGGARRRGRLDLGVGVDRRPARLARRGRADRRGGGPAPPARARAAALRLGPRGLDRVAAGDARADAARPPRRRRPARPVRVLRR